MHVVDDIKCVDVDSNEPVDHVVVLLENVIVVEVVAFDRTVTRTNLLAGDFVATTIDSIEEALCKVCTSAEELHFLTHNHGAYAACNRVVVAVVDAHKVIVLVLNGRSVDGDLCAVTLKALR